jgi:hypothetical protein
LSPFAPHGSLQTQIQVQIETAIGQILNIMNSVESIVSKYQIKEINLPAPPSNRVASGLGTVLPLVGTRPNLGQAGATAKRQQSAQLLQKMTSTRLRILYGSRPWGESDKAELEGLVTTFQYWNNCLRELLPPSIARSVAQQAPLGQTFVEENKDALPDLIKAFADGNDTAWRHANLWQVREEFEDKWDANKDEMRGLRLEFDENTFLNTKSDLQCSSLELRDWVNVKDGPQQIGIKWYPYHQKWSTDDLKLADKRMTELTYTCATERKPKAIHILDSLGFIQDVTDHRASGFVFKLPPNAHPSFVPRSLTSLLPSTASNRRKPNFRLLSLEERLQLAYQLASSLHSLAVVRWLHQNLASCHIVFFMDISTSRLQLDSPYVTGFAISRPEGHEQVSLNKDVEKNALHLHPDLRAATSPESRPRYIRLDDIYSLGILLYEIGARTHISAVASRALDPADFREAVIARCRKELAFYVGARY